MSLFNITILLFKSKIEKILSDNDLLNEAGSKMSNSYKYNLIGFDHLLFVCILSLLSFSSLLSILLISLFYYVYYEYSFLL